MSHFRQLVQQTACARREFIEIPLIQEVMRKGASRALYLDFLRQAYHHVRCTAPLLALAASRCGSDDRRYQTALFEYIHEERGHDEWILEDIEALGGDPHSVRHGSPHFPCRIMIGHAYYLVDHVSPYALLGMIHVLEGMAVALASNAHGTRRRRRCRDVLAIAGRRYQSFWGQGRRPNGAVSMDNWRRWISFQGAPMGRAAAGLERRASDWSASAFSHTALDRFCRGLLA